MLHLDPNLIATPISPDDRDALAAALTRAGLMADDIHDDGPLFWRFTNQDNVPAGFGGIEVHGDLALLRSIVVLPVVRQHGFGHAIVAALENEARARHARTAWLFTNTARRYFEHLGFRLRSRDEIPGVLKASRQYAHCDTADAMSKSLAPGGPSAVMPAAG